ncbi:MAG: M56 family metallopeptidase [Planctomycetaceae bacterium]
MTATGFLELFVSVSVQAALVVIITHWLGRMTNNERLHCRLWSLCYLVLLLLVAIGLLLPHPRLFQPWTGVGGDNAATLFYLGMRVGRALLVVWLAGATVSLLLFVVSWVQTFRFLKTCQPIDPAVLSIDKLAAHECSEAERRSTGKTLLLTSTGLATPFCWQLHRPYIVLPEYLLGFGEQELRFIIRHELAHLGNGHPLQLFLQRVVEILFWFHPMVWWASQQSAFAREFACDDAAVDSPTEIGAYLRSLLTIVERGAADPEKVRGPLAFGGGKSIVSKRARRLVQIAHKRPAPDRRPVPDSVLSASLIFAAALTAFVWLPVNVLASPRASWSPWPAWTSAVLHDFGVSARDFDIYYGGLEPHELLEHIHSVGAEAVAPESKRD